jgi:TPR repeat protein
MSKPFLSPLQCRQLYQALSPKVHTLRYQGAQPNTPLKRAFHTTQSRSAIPRRSPRARQLTRRPEKRWTTQEGLKIDAEGLAVDYITSDVTAPLSAFDQCKKDLYERCGDLLPPGVNLETFDRVLQELIISSHSKAPTANNIRAISVGKLLKRRKKERKKERKKAIIPTLQILTIQHDTDVDALFRIATALRLFRSIPKALDIYTWAASACARAKSRRALVTSVLHYIHAPTVDIHQNTESIAQVKDIAMRDEFPPAIMVYVQILIWRGDYAAAIDLLEDKILPYITPTRVEPNLYEDLTFLGMIDSPIRMYSLAIAGTHGVEGVKAAMRYAAMEYHDPVSLSELAILHLETSDWDTYEQYMGMAAMSGNGPACLYLANFYYRISQGEIPTRADRKADEIARISEKSPFLSWMNSFVTWFDSKVNPQLTREDYRKHAMDWYELAFELGENGAGLIMAMLLRQDGLLDVGRAVYDAAAEKGLPANVPRKGLVELEDRWNDMSFEPGLPPKLMGIR